MVVRMMVVVRVCVGGACYGGPEVFGRHCVMYVFICVILRYARREAFKNNLA